MLMKTSNEYSCGLRCEEKLEIGPHLLIAVSGSAKLLLQYLVWSSALFGRIQTSVCTYRYTHTYYGDGMESQNG